MKNLLLFVMVMVCFGSYAASPQYGNFSNDSFKSNSFNLSNKGLSNSVVKINETQNTTNTPTTWNNTNNVDNLAGQHITVTIGKCIITSSDGAFGGLYRGCQIDHFPNNMQLWVERVIDANTAVAYQVNQGTYGIPAMAETAETVWRIRPPSWRWSDNTIGAFNEGGIMDDNGMMWVRGINNSGSWGMYDDTTGTMIYASMQPEAAIGITTTPPGGMIYSINAITTNNPTGNNAPLAQLFAHSSATAEAFGVLPDDTVAIGGGAQGDGTHQTGFTNRHGNEIPFWSSVKVYTNFSVKPGSYVDFGSQTTLSNLAPANVLAPAGSNTPIGSVSVYVGVTPVQGLTVGKRQNGTPPSIIMGAVPLSGAGGGNAGLTVFAGSPSIGTGSGGQWAAATIDGTPASAGVPNTNYLVREQIGTNGIGTNFNRWYNTWTNTAGTNIPSTAPFYALPVFQGGTTNVAVVAAAITVNFLKPMPDTNYTGVFTFNGLALPNTSAPASKGTNSMTSVTTTFTGNCDWSIMEQTQ